jgi:hypothetical protein
LNKIGQFICAFAQTFTLFIPTKFAFAWFPEHQRTLANSLCFASKKSKNKNKIMKIYFSANFLGVFIGTVLPPIIVPRSDRIPLLVRIDI